MPAKLQALAILVECAKEINTESKSEVKAYLALSILKRAYEYVRFMPPVRL
jgi:hypothetical protein